MKILLKAKNPKHLKNAIDDLQSDGWVAEPYEDGYIFIHQFILTEVQAREKLAESGLIISPAISINFL